MLWKQLLARKSLEKLHEEMLGENRLRRVLGPISLTSLGVGAIIGAGIFVMTGRSAATDAGPAVVLSFIVAGFGCALAALCYAEFAAMAPVAGSAYTYAYATLGEMLAWIIGWDLVLEYAMACACVSASWSKYFNEFLKVCYLPPVPSFLSHDPFSTPGAWFNLPAALITLAVTVILVIGIRESATTNAVLVGVKVGVVLFVILVGAFFIDASKNWFGVPVADRITPAESAIPKLAAREVQDGGRLSEEEARKRVQSIVQTALRATQDEARGGEEAARQRLLGENLERGVMGFWEETAKLPEAEAERRTQQLTIRVLAAYKIQQKQEEVAPLRERGEMTEAQAQEAVGNRLAEVVARYATLLREHTDDVRRYQSAEQAQKSEKDVESMFRTILVGTVVDATAELRNQGKMTAEEARQTLKEAVTQYTDRMEKEHKLTPEQAQERLTEALKLADQRVPPAPEETAVVQRLFKEAEKEAPQAAAEKWGILAYLGLNQRLVSLDDMVRSPYIPYGFSGIMLGAAIVFFAYIGFDSISTHSEEAVRPQRDVPFGILASLVICTVLYIAVSAVITGMERYPDINQEAAIAAAFRKKSDELGGSALLRLTAGLIAVGALAGMTSVLLITFLSQARIFLAMARDKLLPPSIFGAVHHRFKTPHISTILTGCIIAVVSAFTPITKLEEMVNIGTLMAFVIVCAAVLLLRIRRPEAARPFRTPLLFVVAPLGVVVNLFMTLFLPIDTWLRLVVWLLVGLCIYFGYGMRHSDLGQEMRGEIKSQGGPV